MASARGVVEHTAPGRVRLRVQGTPKQRAAALKAVEDVAQNPAVSSVETDPRTGSALISFDSEEMNVEDMFAEIREAHEAFEDLLPPRMALVVDRDASAVASTVMARATAANQRVRGATDGVLDLRMLVPLGFAGLSARQLLRQGISVKGIPWYVLAWYSFDSFIKLHPREHGSSARISGE